MGTPIPNSYENWLDNDNDGDDFEFPEDPTSEGNDQLIDAAAGVIARGPKKQSPIASWQAVEIAAEARALRKSLEDFAEI